MNTEGSYDCECDAGYEYDSFDYYSFYDKEGGTMMLLCKDIDECIEDESGEKLNNCDTNASCINTDGSFECSCNDAYSWCLLQRFLSSFSTVSIVKKVS